MDSFIMELINDYLGISCVIIVLIICLIVFLSIKGYKTYSRIKAVDSLKDNVDKLTRSLDSFNSNMKHLPCSGHKEHISKLDSSFHDLDKQYSDINAKLKMLLEAYPIGPGKAILQIASQKESPRKLNARGQQIYKDADGESFLKEHQEMLFEAIKALTPNTAYDVERAAFLALKSNSEKECYNGLKNFVYNAKSIKLEGGKTYDLTLSDLCFILSIPLRDKYLTDHPEIPEGEEQ